MRKLIPLLALFTLSAAAQTDKHIFFVHIKQVDRITSGDLIGYRVLASDLRDDHDVLYTLHCYRDPKAETQDFDPCRRPETDQIYQAVHTEKDGMDLFKDFKGASFTVDSETSPNPKGR